MLYDGWDGLGDLTKDNGLYGREVGFTALSETNYKDTDALCLLQAEAAISAGQQVIQEITIDNKGKITDNQVRIFDNLLLCCSCIEGLISAIVTLIEELIVRVFVD